MAAAARVCSTRWGASSHGCIRVDNTLIDWLIRTIGAAALPVFPVHVA